MSSVQKPLLVDDCIGVYRLILSNILGKFLLQAVERDEISGLEDSPHGVWKKPGGEHGSGGTAVIPLDLGNLQGIDGCKGWINHGHALELWKYSGTLAPGPCPSQSP